MKSGKTKMEEEEEHKVYGGEIPEVAGELVDPNPDIDMSCCDDVDSAKKLEEMKRVLKEMEKEADALREMQAKFEKDVRAVVDR